jgi:hypothetical protein
MTDGVILTLIPMLIAMLSKPEYTTKINFEYETKPLSSATDFYKSLPEKIDRR